MRKVLLFIAASTVLLTGCFFPEKFDASVTINADRSHIVKFDGRLVHILAHKAKVDNKGQMPKGGEKAIDSWVADAKKDPAVKSASRYDDTRMNAVFDKTFKPGQRSSLFDMLHVRTNQDGTMEIRSLNLTPKDLEEIKKLNLKLDGAIKVYLPANAEVIKTNAHSKPGILDKSYSWILKSPTDAPYMLVRLK